MKSCKSHEKNETKNIRLLCSFHLFINKSSMLILNFFHVVFKISNFNKWTAKHLVQPSCTKLTLSKIGIFSNNKSLIYWRIFLKTYLLLTPIKALTPFNLVLTLPCPTMKVMSKKLGTSSWDLGYWKALVKSLASWSCPSKRSRTESNSGLEGLIWPMGRQEPRLKKEKDFIRQPIKNVTTSWVFLLLWPVTFVTFEVEYF